MAHTARYFTAADGSVEIRVEPEPAAVGQASLQLLVDRSKSAIRERGQFVLAVSGGSIPPLLSALVDRTQCDSEINIDKWKFLFADERCVPLDDTDSNFKLWKESIFDHIPQIDVTQSVLTVLHPENPSACASDYSSRLSSFLSLDRKISIYDTIIDFCILGMGPDGHTASLFPNHPLVTAQDDRVISSLTDSPKPPSARITFSLQAINNAREVLFIVTGAGKAPVIESIFQVEAAEGRCQVFMVPSVAYPASLVRTADRPVLWVLDAAAGAPLCGR